VAWRVPGEEEPRALELTSPALAISSPYGKAFVRDGRTLGHVLDPKTGEPTQGTRSAVVAGHSSTMCDALSTALLVRGESWCRSLAVAFPGYSGKAA
jgi:thiamine biosynthesis lipoprotein